MCVCCRRMEECLSCVNLGHQETSHFNFPGSWIWSGRWAQRCSSSWRHSPAVCEGTREICEQS